MAKLPHIWLEYERLQSRLSSLTNLDDHAWGLEGGLNAILEPDFSPAFPDPEIFRRAVASAARKHRDHQARFLTQPEEDWEAPDEKDLSHQVAARFALRALDQGLANHDDIELFTQLAEGHDYEHMAETLGGPANSLRCRTLRLRRQFAHLLH